MSDRSLRRLGAASGIFYVVLTILGSDVLGGTKTGVGILVELLGSPSSRSSSVASGCVCGAQRGTVVGSQPLRLRVAWWPSL
jgi:hypothetical protein